LKTTEYCCNL